MIVLYSQISGELSGESGNCGKNRHEIIRSNQITEILCQTSDMPCLPDSKSRTYSSVWMKVYFFKYVQGIETQRYGF